MSKHLGQRRNQPQHPIADQSGLMATSSVRTNPTSQPAVANSLSWQAASRKLTELGIEKYHLERGQNEGAFLFVCLFTPGDAPNVTHRFEAEAADPLQAVNQVLGEIDRWLQQRYAANSFPHTL